MCRVDQSQPESVPKKTGVETWKNAGWDYAGNRNIKVGGSTGLILARGSDGEIHIRRRTGFPTILLGQELGADT